jgi:hypothetical protein
VLFFFSSCAIRQTKDKTKIQTKKTKNKTKNEKTKNKGTIGQQEQKTKQPIDQSINQYHAMRSTQINNQWTRTTNTKKTKNTTNKTSKKQADEKQTICDLIWSDHNMSIWFACLFVVLLTPVDGRWPPPLQEAGAARALATPSTWRRARQRWLCAVQPVLHC